jgi:hypothetical protein
MTTAAQVVLGRVDRRPDILGCYYGACWWNGQPSGFTLVPPAPLWRGSIPPKSKPPHERLWSVWMGGRLVARFPRRKDLAGALAGAAPDAFAQPTQHQG